MADRYYEKLGEDGNVKRCPSNDDKGEITGKFILNLEEYFDENPEERIRLGWTKHIMHKPSEVVEYDPQTQYLIRGTRQIDEYTVEDVFYPIDKSEEMMLFEEQYNLLMNGSDTGSWAVWF